MEKVRKWCGQTPLGSRTAKERTENPKTRQQTTTAVGLLSKLKYPTRKKSTTEEPYKK